MRDTIWMTKDRQAIPVRQMDYGHLLRCIDKIRRSPSGWRRQYLPRLELELVIRALDHETN